MYISYDHYKNIITTRMSYLKSYLDVQRSLYEAGIKLKNHIFYNTIICIGSENSHGINFKEELVNKLRKDKIIINEKYKIKIKEIMSILKELYNKRKKNAY